MKTEKLAVPAQAKNISVAIKPAKVSGAEGFTYVAVPTNTAPAPVRWALAAFVFTIPFEAQELAFLPGYVSPARISGLLFFFIYLLYHIPLAGRGFPSLSAPLYWVLAYVAVFVVGGMIFGGGLGGIIVRLITLLQLFALLWLASDMLKDVRFATRLLLTYVVSLFIVALAINFGLFGLSHEVVPGRTTVLQDDLNGIATQMGMAVLICVGLYFSSGLKGVTLKLVLLSATIIPLIALVKTGSRGGLVAFVAGLFVFLFPYVRGKWRLAPAALAAVIVVASAYMVASHPDFVERWRETYQDRSLSQRELLYPIVIEMIVERPVFGWHHESWQHMFRQGMWGAADPHNLFLHLLLEGGVVGTIPFLVVLWICGLYAWRAREGTLGLLPLALFTTSIVAGLSLTTLTWKPVWLIMALAIASWKGMTEWYAPMRLRR